MHPVLQFLTAITVAQLLAHFIGDYLLQSTWMAVGKVKSFVPATVHALVYSLPFVLILHPSLAAWFVIVSTHIVIDRYRLAKHVCWLKNWLSPRPPKPLRDSLANNGFDSDVPEYMSFWLMVITDNLLHVLINGAALYFLP